MFDAWTPRTAASRPRLGLARGLALAALCAGVARAAVDDAFGAAAQRQNWSEALAVVDRQLRQTPADPALQVRRAIALGQLGRRSEGIELLRRVISAGHGTLAAHNNLAVMLAAEGRPEEARRSLDLALRAEGQAAVAFDNLSRLSAQLAADAYIRALYPEQGKGSAMPVLAWLVPGPAAPAPAVAPARLPAAAAPSTAAPSTAAPATAAPAPAAPAPAPAAASSPSPPTARVAGRAPRPVAAAGAAGAAPSAAPAAPPAAARAPGEEAAVRAALEAWAGAWSRRDMNAYVAAYVPGYEGRAASHEAWKRERSATISAEAAGEVALSDFQLAVGGNRAVASFVQDYRSDGRPLRSRKRAVLQKVGENWLIAEESSP
jgi:ketosteroid isomerase-like protein